MEHGFIQVPTPENEPVRGYAPGSPERVELERALETVAAERPTIPVRVGGDKVETGDTFEVTAPHDKGHVLGVLHQARKEDVGRAIDGAMAVAPAWREMSFTDRAAIFLKAAELLAGPWRARINAACMLGQSKTAHQSEIDAACELIDFWRFNVAYAAQIYSVQPRSIPRTAEWNRSDYRALEGFVLAVTPFNFLSIAANLPTAPALMGNVVLWKPANQTGLGAHYLLELLQEAGLPDGVISFLPGDGPTQGNAALDSEHLAGIHFTGSTGTFKALWRGAAERLDRYKAFPRVVGETGGKDFIVAHPSADPVAVATAVSRGSFEYQGQKCSAASRVYIPASLWPEVRDRIVADTDQMGVGDPRDFKNFMGAVIDERAFTKISGYLGLAGDGGEVVRGGKADDAKGWFVEPTIVQVKDPKHRLMQEEIFGPVVTVYVYPDDGWSEDRWLETLRLVDETSPYGLTGAVFARERRAVRQAIDGLRNAAGNFYVNDKPTGAVVSQQPFGGARGSGTNDKAGSLWNLTRWVSPRSIKEHLVPPRAFPYPYMG
jgi:1-pyrroline-5-carboxylate dehydrogenase